MEYETILSDIKKRNFAEVPFKMTSVELTEAAEAYIDFLTLPLETKKLFHFKVDPGSKRTDVGYRRRHEEIGNADNKEFFHYHELAKTRFKDLVKLTGPKAEKFFNYAENVFRAASSALSDILRVIDEKVPGVHDKLFLSETFPSFYLRFLKYDVRGSGNFLATGHYDTGGMTLAIAESAPGLRIGKNDLDIKEVPPRQSGTALFMPALRFIEIDPALCEFTPAWHDVIQKSADVYSNGVARWAIVFFADPSSINRLSSKEAHTPKR